jgi:DNA invertase Pin-like site-specific DNA recombinase
MPQGRFISYLRVSTGKQGASGLGLEVQRETVRQSLNGGAWELIGEFVEVESGKRTDRPQLAAALGKCRLMTATLVVANVSRLTRNPDFMATIVSSGVEVRFCDLPKVEGPAGRFMLRQMLAVAELEAGLISERTRKALAAARARGVKLGKPENLSNQEEGRRRGRARRTKIADLRAGDLATVLKEVQSEGASSLRQIAAVLNARGVPTARGGTWSAVQVSRIMERLQ